VKNQAVFLVVTDLHKSEKNLDNRYDYVGEVMYSVKQLLLVLDKYKDCDCLSVLWLGDIFHNSYRTPAESGSDVSLMARIGDHCDYMYSVVGNHELTYYRDNPFWSLVNSIDSEAVKGIVNKNWQPRGYKDIITILDYLVVGDVCFYFNHYGCDNLVAKRHGEKVSIGLYHKPICTPDIYTDMKLTYGTSMWEHDSIDFQSNDIFGRYDWVFLGHYHSIYGKWKLGDSTNVYYLASHGRTAHPQVCDVMLERNFPAIILEKGSESDVYRFSRVEDNLYRLWSRAESVCSEVVLENQKIYQEKKVLDTVRNQVLLSRDPLDNLRARLVGFTMANQLLEQILRDEPFGMEQEVISVLRS
jgi:hypothetical protein